MHGELALHVAGVLDLRRLEQHYLDLLLGDRAVLDAARNDNKLAFSERQALIAKVHPEAASQDQKEFIFFGMLVPDEFTLKLHQLHVLAIQFANNARIPMV
jgi:hypothetical protein